VASAAAKAALAVVALAVAGPVAWAVVWAVARPPPPAVPLARVPVRDATTAVQSVARRAEMALRLERRR
jgi:hypothetical protein